MRKKKYSVSAILDTIVTYVILIAISLIFLFPVLWLVLASFSKSGSIYDLDGFFPTEYSLKGYRDLFTDTAMYDYPNWLKNTLFVASCSAIIGTILVILTAYVMSRFSFKMRKPIMKTTLVLSMFPSFMGMTF